MNLVFGSEVALLGFWKCMFQILFRVQGQNIIDLRQKLLVWRTVKNPAKQVTIYLSANVNSLDELSLPSLQMPQ